MSAGAWPVHARGEQVSFEIREEGLVLGGQEVLTVEWADVVAIHFPSSYSVELVPREGDPVRIGFANRHAQREFAGAYSAAAETRGGPAASSPVATSPVAGPPRAEVGLYTIDFIPGRRVVAAIGMVTAQSVMSRQLFSDAGSDLKSLVGGSLGGMEKAVSSGIEKARSELRRQAVQLGGDAVIGVDISIAGVGDKAEAVVVVGTAVRTEPILEDKAAEETAALPPSANPWQ